ncbi:MAG: DNA-directed RNA polymerase subunit F [Candidatus Diapherotrites archaeon]|nr:DNA-directed RNA polymerase subunit F [Candidatus Diapherotrites archaeon]
MSKLIGEQLLERKFLTLTEVKDLLNKRKKEKELTYEQDMALKYSKQFAKLTPAQTKKMIGELKEFPEITEEMAVKIADMVPSEMPILKLIIPKEVKISEESLNKIFEISQKYSKEKKEEEKEE